MKQQGNGQQKHIRLDLIGADDCVYHAGYQELLNWLFLHFGEIFAALNEQRLFAKKHKLSPPEEIKATLAQIQEELSAFNVADLSQYSPADMVNEITQRGKARTRILRDGRTYVESEWYTVQMRYYLNALYSLDPQFLQTIFLRANPELIQYLSANNDDYDQQYMGVGANRQSFLLDLLHMSNNMTGSIFNDVLSLTRVLRDQQKNKKTQVMLQPLTMTDAAKNLPAGESFRRIISHPAGSHLDSICDRSMLALIYMMAHDITLQHPDAAITINFCNPDTTILDQLYEKLHDKPGSDMLPASVKLVLQPYDGKLGESRIVQGTGVVDPDYRNNLRYMMGLAELHRSDTIATGVDVAKDVSIEEFLANRSLKSAAKTLAVMLDADGCIYNLKYFYLVKKLIAAHSKEIKDMARKLDDFAKTEEFTKKLIEEIKAIDLSAVSRDQLADMTAGLPVVNVRISDYDLHADEETYGHTRAALLRQYLRYLHEINPAIGEALLFQANKDLFATIVENAKAQGCSRILFIVGSNRQCEQLDSHNSKNNGTNSYYADLHGLIRYVAEHYKNDIAMDLDEMLLADFYADLEPGESFRRVLRNQQGLAHAGAVFDESKVSLVYGVMHYLVRYHPETCAVAFYDDLGKIFESIMQSYESDDRHQLPPLPLDMTIHDGFSSLAKPMGRVIGTGTPDEDLGQSLKLMATLCGVDLARLPYEAVGTNVADKLHLKLFTDQIKQKKSVQSAEFAALTSAPPARINSMRTLSFFTTAQHQPASICEAAVSLAIAKT